MQVEVIPPKFDLHGYYEYQLKLALKSARLSDEDKMRKLKGILQKAYEQGMLDAVKQKEDYFNNFGEANK
jgi:hypothetical protein